MPRTWIGRSVSCIWSPPRACPLPSSALPSELKMFRFMIASTTVSVSVIVGSGTDTTGAAGFGPRICSGLRGASKKATTVETTVAVRNDAPTAIAILRQGSGLSFFAMISMSITTPWPASASRYRAPSSRAIPRQAQRRDPPRGTGRSCSREAPSAARQDAFSCLP